MVLYLLYLLIYLYVGGIITFLKVCGAFKKDKTQHWGTLAIAFILCSIIWPYLIIENWWHKYRIKKKTIKTKK